MGSGRLGAVRGLVVMRWVKKSQTHIFLIGSQ